MLTAGGVDGGRVVRGYGDFVVPWPEFGPPDRQGLFKNVLGFAVAVLSEQQRPDHAEVGGRRGLRDNRLVTAAGWSASELVAIDGAEELWIAVRRQDGSLRPAVPIWVVNVAGQVYIRTWHRRHAGWFGRVLSSRRARITVGQVVADVGIEDVGSGSPELRAAVDAAYRGKYTRYGPASVDRMVSEGAAAATLRLTRDGEP